MLELRIVSGETSMPIFDLPAALGRQQAARELGDQIDALIAFMDDLSGDCDLEEGGEDEPIELVGDDEPSGDELDASFLEWRDGDAITATFIRGHASALFEEDAEDDDSDRCGASDDMIDSGPAVHQSIVYGFNHDRTEIGDATDAEQGNWPETDGAQPTNGVTYDDGHENDGLHHRFGYRDRIRHTRCTTNVRSSYDGRTYRDYRLRGGGPAKTFRAIELVE